MNPITFPEENKVLLGNGSNVRDLPVFQNQEQTISKWRPSLKDRIRILFGADIWVLQLTQGRGFQPQYIDVDYPFVEVDKNA